MRILGLMVTKNEAHRYLRSVLDWHKWFLDEFAVYDDQSEDDTVKIAVSEGAKVAVRADDVPSFLEHEGRFRQRAWEWLEASLSPEDGDWILLLDADEFLASSQQTPSACMDNAIDYANRHDHDGVEVKIPEVFDTQDGAPLIRIDGYWGDLSQPRLVKWHENAQFLDQAMACGTYPVTVTNPSPHSYGLCILHYGYADAADRAEKYARYSSIKHNHNPQHIESILKPPLLGTWLGPHPPVQRGI